MISNIRRQLTLFVEPKDAETIEQVRQKFNPKQFELIKSHITLCREDEIQDLELVIANLILLTRTPFDIEFGKVKRFDNDNGLFLPATTENEAFDNLRKQILSGLIDNPRKQVPHVTLMHPGNSTCTDDIFGQIKKISFPTKLKFKRISLIEQREGGQWNILQEFGC